MAPFVPPHPDNVPSGGDGDISAFHFYNGKIDLKTRYIDTGRLELERKAIEGHIRMTDNSSSVAANSKVNPKWAYRVGHACPYKERLLRPRHAQQQDWRDGVGVNHSASGEIGKGCSLRFGRDIWSAESQDWID